MRRWRFRITWTIGVLFTGLNLLGIGAVLAIGVYGAGRNTEALLLERLEDAIDTAGDGLELIQRPVAAQARAIADAMRTGRVDLGDQAGLRLFIEGTLATTPQVVTVGILEPSLSIAGFARDAREPPPSLSQEQRAAIVAWARTAGEPRWAHGWSVARGVPVMTRQTPLQRPDGAFVGVLVSVVTVPELTRRIGVVAREVGDPVFVLYERTSVLAHSQPRGSFAPSEQQALPTIAQFGDPVLARIWDDGTPLAADELIAGVSGHRVATPQGVVTFVYHPVDTNGGRSYLIGTYHVGSLAADEVARLRSMAAAGVIVLALSIVATIVIGRRISRPVRALSGAASVVERQEFESFRPLGRSMIREIDEAGRAFNQMVEGLKERERIRNMFGKYVPTEVVQRLLADPDSLALGGDRREISLLFTDITGFTALAETMPPSAVLQLLNAYFEELCRAVHAEQGIVADLIGDAVFAIFGAPIARADHARRAIACARDMDRLAAAFAAARRAEGIALGATRIGVHTGFATVGNFGSADRLKYTAAGDVVNTTARLESANRYFGSRVMASRELVDAAGDRDWRPLAELIVKGRRAALAVVELLPPKIAAEPWVDAYRSTYALLETGSRDAVAALRALAAERPDDPVIRFHRERAEAGTLSVVVELTEK